MKPVEKSESVLIVDDTPANLRLLSSILTEHGYHVRAVSNGSRALVSVEADPPDLILLDIRMPELDGYEVCRWLKERPQTRDIPVIFISALSDIQDKIQAFTSGGVDYVTKPFQLEEVVARVKTHLALRSLQKDLEEANRQMQHELDLAALVQSSIMCKCLPDMPGWRLATQLLPAKLTCGDFFNVIRLSDGSIAILIADVVDKGVGAALYMAMSCSLLRTYIPEYPANPEQAFQVVNRRILEDTDTCQFVTAFLGILDIKTGEMIYSNAGHNPPALVHSDPEQAVELLGRTGTVLGAMEDMSWEQKCTRLAPGDVLVLYTDGITDAENETGKDFGLDRLVQTVRRNLSVSAEAIQDEILADLHRFTGDTEQFDDIALMVLSRNAS